MKKWYRHPDGYKGQPEIWEEGTEPPYDKPIVVLPQLSLHPKVPHQLTDERAQLIVALPDLHDACELALAELKKCVIADDWKVTTAIEILEKALNKAHGQSDRPS